MAHWVIYDAPLRCSNGILVSSVVPWGELCDARCSRWMREPLRSLPREWRLIREHSWSFHGGGTQELCLVGRYFVVVDDVVRREYVIVQRSRLQIFVCRRGVYLCTTFLNCSFRVDVEASRGGLRGTLQ